MGEVKYRVVCRDGAWMIDRFMAGAWRLNVWGPYKSDKVARRALAEKVART